MISVRLFGNAPIEVIGQTRLEPTGEADGAPLAVFAEASSEEKLCPGEAMLVRSVVTMRALAVDSPPVSYGNAAGFAALGIKLRVQTCGGRGFQNQTLVDVGRQVVVHGNVGIEVLAPSGYVTARPTDIESMFEYWVQVVACPVRCCYPPLPQLTFWRAALEGADEVERTWVVPRGARRMEVGELPAGVVAVDLMHQNIVISTLPILAGGFIEIFGAPDRIIFQPAATAPGNILVKWDIEG
jgi:hypothetical protein